ncbi:MAG: phosphatidate cytidylyltransferase [Pseudomonadota bacterium]
MTRQPIRINPIDDMLDKPPETGATDSAILGPKSRGRVSSKATKDTLLLRVISSVALGPMTLVACWFGGQVFALLVALLMSAMVFEWIRMVSGAAKPSLIASSVGFAVVPLACAAFGLYPIAHSVAISGGLVTAALSATGQNNAQAISSSNTATGRWVFLGTIYIVLPCIALIWIRESIQGGRILSIALFLIVWAADIGGYAFGRFMGGPKLSPVLSPAKTWAGAVGGVLLGSAAGFLIGSFAANGEGALPALVTGYHWAALGGVIGFISIVGDMLESGFKRRFGVKDTSGIIPGHGGVLDRLDGMILVTAAVSLFLFGYTLFA